MKTLAIIGSKDLGQQIAHYALTDKHYKKVVFIDDYTSKRWVDEIEIVGKTHEIEKLYKKECFDELLIGIGYKHISKREEIFEFYRKKIPWGKLIHSSSWIDPSAEIKDGCIIYPNCSIDMRSTIGENTIVNNGCTISHDTQIGEHCFLSPRIAIAGFVKIGKRCILGINATVIDNVTIADRTQLGSATNVIRSITKSGLYVGNPHRFIR